MSIAKKYTFLDSLDNVFVFLVGIHDSIILECQKNVLRDLLTNQQISSKMKYIAGIFERHKVVTEAWYFLNKNLLDLKKFF